MNGCSSTEIKELEKVQLQTAGIVTELPILASKESLYMCILKPFRNLYVKDGKLLNYLQCIRFTQIWNCNI